MEELIKVVAELVNAQLGIVNIDDGRRFYNINWITIDNNDKIVVCDIESQTHFIYISNIKSIKYCSLVR